MNDLAEHASFGLDAVAAMTMGMDIRHTVAMETRFRLECRDRAGNLRWEAEGHNRVVTAGLNEVLAATFTTGLASPAWYCGLVGASITDANITSGSASLGCASSNDWQSQDAGRAIIVRGAGASGADLVTTISAYGSAGSVTLAASAGTTVSGAECTWDARAADTMASHAPWAEVTAYSNSNRPAWTGGAVSGGSVSNSGSPAVFNINANNTDIFGAFLVSNNTVGGASGTLYGMGLFATPGSRRAQSGDTLSLTSTLSAASQ